jgi:N-methylhydantoinase A/oxoprolinase/acetone carboxylase beta subunit
MIQVILAAILVGLLTACGMGNAPDRALVEKAIATQVRQTQQELSQQLFRGAVALPEARLSRVTIQDRHRLSIENRTAYRIRGTYDVTLEQLKRRVTQRQNPFEVYLQQAEDKTWRVAHRSGNREESLWVKQSIER